MEFKYIGWIVVGIIITVCLILIGVFLLFKKQTYKEGIKAANLDLFLQNPYYKRKLIVYYVGRIVLAISIGGMIIVSCLLLARPFHTEKYKEDQYNRDIIICLDISTSVNDLNVKLVAELEKTVRELNGERIGIVIFNTSPILLSPLTDDYEYTIEQLQKIGTAIRSTDSDYYHKMPEDYLYWYEFLMGGTLVGNEEHGSSLIGDGLAGAAFCFPKTVDERSRSIIFATDNDLNGTPYVTLMNAAKLCKRNKITVYGIGTKEMYQKDIEEMSQAVKLTGGSFYLEENASTFHKIVEDIEAQTASKIPGKMYVREVEEPTMFFYMLVGFGVLLTVATVLIWQVNPGRILEMVAMTLIGIIFFINVILPARQPLSENRFVQNVEGDLQVVFVVDNTISMVAQDYQGYLERLEGVRSDCNKIINELEGAKFAVISFQNVANIMSPFTRNAEHTRSVLESIYPMSELYANGTSLNLPRDTMQKVLEDAKKNEKLKTVVFFFSDGEITDESKVESYDALARYIDGGAVLGYGTAAGGQMEIEGRFDEEKSLIMDYSNGLEKEAISKMDEKNLKRLAKQMGIDYFNRNDGDNTFDSLLADLKKDMKISTQNTKQSDGVEELMQPYPNRPEYWLMLFILLISIREGVAWIQKK